MLLTLLVDQGELFIGEFADSDYLGPLAIGQEQQVGANDIGGVRQ